MHKQIDSQDRPTIEFGHRTIGFAYCIFQFEMIKLPSKTKPSREDHGKRRFSLKVD